MTHGSDDRPPGERSRTRSQVATVLLTTALVGLLAGIGITLLVRGGSSATTAKLAASQQTPGGLLGQAIWRSGTRPAPVIDTLRDQTGRAFSLASLRGRTVAIEFFDSHCLQECPLAGRALAAAERTLPAAQRPVLVVVSVNPKDTATSVRAAIRKWGLAGVSPWHWLMGHHAQLAPVWNAYGIYVRPTKGDIIHTQALYLLDRRGDERSVFLYPYIPAQVSRDLKLLAGSVVEPA